ncbi:MAG: xanthine dehydrogenase family protein subunit M [Caldisericaceae bacterium]|nr:xanthine dehydrogenase family protein subunit M [Caldisericaceae bacterium]
MREFDYFRASSLKEALEILDEFQGNIKVLAAGTDLVVRLKNNMVKEGNILDISRVKELKGIFTDGNILHILPLTTHSEIIEYPDSKKVAQVLYDACRTVGSPQIRNRGTLGGNVANASPAGDTIPALFVQEAKLKLQSKDGERVISVEDFFTGPGKTVMKPNELLTDISFPKMEEDEIGFFKKLGQRNALAISMVSVAAKLKKSGVNRFDKALVAFGAVAPTVVRGTRVENALTDTEVDSPEKIRYIAQLAWREVSPISDVRASLQYRQDMSINLLYEGLLELYKNGWNRR